MQEIIIATSNAGKAKEFKKFFEPQGLIVKTLKDYPNLPEIIEDGTTFQENAVKKAQTIADYLKVPVLADDSGLMVDYLNGEPGIYSARYAKDHDDGANNQKLLANLKRVNREQRTAHFHCAIAIACPDKAPLIVEGRVNGEILTAPQGENGFGYDPLFFYPPLQKSFAQLTMEEKNQISHRGQAIKALKNMFKDWWE